MEPKFVDLERFNIVGLAGRFIVGETEGIAALWEEFIGIWMKTGEAFPNVSYGVCYDESGGDTEGATPFTYLAAFRIKDPAKAPKGLATRVIPANHYAVFTHTGEVASIPKSYEEIYGTWMPKSGYATANGPEFELYDERFDEETMSGEVDIYIPVVKSS